MLSGMMNTFEALTDIAADVYAYRGTLACRARNGYPEETGILEWLRARVQKLAFSVAHDADLAERVFLALAWACRVDDWATRELAARFGSLCLRLQLIAAVECRSDAKKHRKLLAALSSRRCSASDIAAAKLLAA